MVPQNVLFLQRRGGRWRGRELAQGVRKAPDSHGELHDRGGIVAKARFLHQHDGAS